ncbi:MULTISPECIES: hypothetical protein [Streptomyces]
MAKDYDSQLLESVSVRRRRMRDALLFGAQRARRTADEKLGKVFAGIAIAAVLCAGCVGWSFIKVTLAKQKEQQKQQQQRYAPATPGPSASADATPSVSPSAVPEPAASHTKAAKKPKGTQKVTEPSS